MASQQPVTFAKDAAFVLVAGYFPSRVVEKELRKTLRFCAAYDSIPLTHPVSLDTVNEFAGLFRKHLRPYGAGDNFDASCSEANAAAIAALREWWSRYRDISQLM